MRGADSVAFNPPAPRRVVTRVLCVLASLLLLAACSGATRPASSAPPGAAADANDALVVARHLWRDAAENRRAEPAARGWLRCAIAAHQAEATVDEARRDEATVVANSCTSELIGFLLKREPPLWTPRTVSIAGVKLDIVFRDMPRGFSDRPLALLRADAVSIPAILGRRYATPGFGVSMAAWQARCTDRPICALYPPEGITRPVTAWVETDAEGTARLVMTDPLLHPTLAIGDRQVTLATDVTAPLAALIERTRINRLALWTLVGGKQLAMREGLYLLEDYDPDKTPVIMLHGLGRSPLVWAKLTNMMIGAPDLRARYQVWHIVYPTNTPVLLNRLRVQRFLDRGWLILDPEGAAPAHKDMVLIGHSMGGVLSRLLASNSGDVLWHAAFDVPPSAVNGSRADVAVADEVFHFRAYPGITREIFLAAPHLGSPVADHFLGHLAVRLVSAHAPELDALGRLVDANAEHISPELLKDYRTEGLSSVSTLRANQPVSRASHALMPVAGVRYYTFAGNLPGEDPPGDGVVPLKSAMLEGAVSTTIVRDGHQLYLNQDVLAKILDILRQP
ncbi:esterase/lipase family protein [Dyella soli]